MTTDDFEDSEARRERDEHSEAHDQDQSRNENEKVLRVNQRNQEVTTIMGTGMADDGRREKDNSIWKPGFQRKPHLAEKPTQCSIGKPSAYHITDHSTADGYSAKGCVADVAIV
ncbi:hypothetical protein C8R45DRAFT_941658 [Mycena sanguinolenta]|nr:hypothetical protein C8R45DRAFT_941658 [Mycena sanguinolenta]